MCSRHYSARCAPASRRGVGCMRCWALTPTCMLDTARGDPDVSNEMAFMQGPRYYHREALVEREDSVMWGGRVAMREVHRDILQSRSPKRAPVSSGDATRACSDPTRTWRTGFRSQRQRRPRGRERVLRIAVPRRRRSRRTGGEGDEKTPRQDAQPHVCDGRCGDLSSRILRWSRDAGPFDRSALYRHRNHTSSRIPQRPLASTHAASTSLRTSARKIQRFTMLPAACCKSSRTPAWAAVSIRRRWSRNS